MVEPIILLLASILSAVLQKTYLYLSMTNAQPGTARISKHLRIALKHVNSVSALLAAIKIAAFALFAISISFLFGVVPAFLLIFSFFLLIFVFLPKAHAGNSLLLARLTARPLAYFLGKFENQIRKSDRYIERLDKKLYRVEPIGRDGLIKFLKEQEAITEGDVNADLGLALSSVSLNSQKISYLMIRKKKARVVGVNEPVGPVLLSELHETGRKTFPAADQEKDFVGTISLERLSELKSGGKASK
ncbi:MAG TPA: hypothetical protein VD947_00485, partial [Patescibacteria group bacterium]|nr:hypothetical protein [Patescibacteria group bacterium]